MVRDANRSKIIYPILRRQPRRPAETEVEVIVETETVVQVQSVNDVFGFFKSAFSGASSSILCPGIISPARHIIIGPGYTTRLAGG